MPGLSFLNKKSWHTTNVKNVERVWLAEKKADEEQKRLMELQKQLQEERQILELRQLQAAHGQVTKTIDNSLDWMYEGPVASNQKQQSSEEYLLGKIYNGAADHSAKVEAIPDVKAPAKWLNKVASKNDSFSRSHEDPFIMIKQEENKRREKVINNPIKMDKIKQKIASELKEKDDKKAMKKLAKREKKEHKKEAKRRKKESRKGENTSSTDVKQDGGSSSSSDSDGSCSDREGDHRRHALKVEGQGDSTRKRTHSRSRSRSPARDTRSPAGAAVAVVKVAHQQPYVHPDRRAQVEAANRAGDPPGNNRDREPVDRDRRRGDSRDRRGSDRRDPQRDSRDRGDRPRGGGAEQRGRENDGFRRDGDSRNASYTRDNRDGRDSRDDRDNRDNRDSKGRRRSNSRTREPRGRNDSYNNYSNRDRQQDNHHRDNNTNNTTTAAPSSRKRDRSASPAAAPAADRTVTNRHTAHSDSENSDSGRPKQQYGLIINKKRFTDTSSSSSNTSSLGPNPALLQKKLEVEKAAEAARRNRTRVDVRSMTEEERLQKVLAMQEDAQANDSVRATRHSVVQGPDGTEENTGNAAFLETMRKTVYTAKDIDMGSRIDQNKYNRQSSADIDSAEGFLTKM